jgi:putative thioredoxin
MLNANTMGSSITVTNATFAADVLEQSHQKPVLVDFYAHWCGPCQMLKPMLEKLVLEYDFVLAKVDIDEDPELASTYGVEGVPDVKLFSQGEIKDVFVGALPEPQLRDFLAKHDLKSDVDRGLDQMKAAIAAGDLTSAKDQMGDLLDRYPQTPKLLIEAAKFLVRVDHFDPIEQFLAGIQASDQPYFEQAQAVRALVQFKQILQEPTEGELAERYAQACRDTLTEAYEPALQGFLNIVNSDRNYRNDGARKAMLTVFSLLGNEHPLTVNYRKQLMMALY